MYCSCVCQHNNTNIKHMARHWLPFKAAAERTLCACLPAVWPPHSSAGSPAWWESEACLWPWQLRPSLSSCAFLMKRWSVSNRCGYELNLTWRYWSLSSRVCQVLKIVCHWFNITLFKKKSKLMQKLGKFALVQAGHGSQAQITIPA